MDSWTSCLLAFVAGIGAGLATGIALVSLKPYVFAAKKRRTELVVARSRILTGIKEKHEEEILDEAFRTTEAIKGELDKSLQTLRRALNAVMIPAIPESPQQKTIIQLSDPVKSGQSPS
jgi:hypothetical protein